MSCCICEAVSGRGGSPAVVGDLALLPEQVVRICVRPSRRTASVQGYDNVAVGLMKARHEDYRAVRYDAQGRGETAS